MASIKSGNRTLRVYSPVSGIIKHYNSNANKCVSGKDVYQKGWLYLIEPTHWIQEIKNLYFAKKAEKWIQTELNRLRDFFAFSTRKFGFDPGMVVLQEGGPIEEAALQDMPEEFWYEFQVEFIDAMRKFES